MAAVIEWLEPTTVKELQCIANLYRQFISSVAAPLTSLLRRGKKRRIHLTPTREQHLRI